MLTLVAFIRKVFTPKEDYCHIISLFTLFIISIIVFSLLYHFVCTSKEFDSSILSPKGEHLKPVDEFFDLVYFSFITQSTTGFGDIAPRGKLAKMIVMLQVLSILFIASM